MGFLSRTRAACGLYVGDDKEETLVVVGGQSYDAISRAARGFDSLLQSSSEVFHLGENGGSWKLLEYIGSARVAEAVMVRHHGQLYYIGGRGVGAAKHRGSKDAYKYDGESQMWIRQPQMSLKADRFTSQRDVCIIHYDPNF